jgi:hypothetical protein
MELSHLRLRHRPWQTRGPNACFQSPRQQSISLRTSPLAVPCRSSAPSYAREAAVGMREVGIVLGDHRIEASQRGVRTSSLPILLTNRTIGPVIVGAVWGQAGWPVGPFRRRRWVNGWIIRLPRIS